METEKKKGGDEERNQKYQNEIQTTRGWKKK